MEPEYATARAKLTPEVQRKLRQLTTPEERAAARRRRLAELEAMVAADAAADREHGDDAA